MRRVNLYYLTTNKFKIEWLLLFCRRRINAKINLNFKMFTTKFQRFLQEQSYKPLFFQAVIFRVSMKWPYFLRKICEIFAKIFFCKFCNLCKTGSIAQNVNFYAKHLTANWPKLTVSAQSSKKINKIYNHISYDSAALIGYF